MPVTDNVFQETQTLKATKRKEKMENRRKDEPNLKHRKKLIKLKSNNETV